MFLRLFRSGTNLQIVIFSLSALLLWVDGIFEVKTAFNGTIPFPLYGFLFGWTATFPAAGNILALLMLVMEALLLNALLVMAGVTVRNSYLPALIYILFFSYLPGLLCMHPVIPGNLMVILSLRMVIKTLHKEEAYQEVFSSALFFSVAVLFNIYYLLLLPLVWISLLINRSLGWREWMIATLGVLTPLVYASFVFFWDNRLEEALTAYSRFFRNTQLMPAVYNYHWMVWILVALVMVTGIAATLYFISGISEKLISIRRVSQIIIWMFFLSAIAVYFISDDSLVMGSFVLLPMSVFVACWFQSPGRLWIKESLFWMLAAGIAAGKFLI